MSKIRLIGDIHGNFAKYHNLIKKSEYSIQLGDFGFDYSTLKSVSETNHFVLLGNHDNYDKKCTHSLGNFGIININGCNIFFIRGALSVDKQWRIPGVSWWKQEQLSFKQMEECFKLYTQIKPNIVISHDCPKECLPYLHKELLGLNSATQQLLSACFNSHNPARWFFAHHHKNWQGRINNTNFRCLGEFEAFDF